MKKVVKILSIDGGGIRGIIPAVLLTEIERRTQRPIYELFDLVVGTSTGAILALALVKPSAQKKPQYTANNIVGLYEQEGSKIFSRSLGRTTLALGNLLEEKYPVRALEKILATYFGDARLKDALTPVVITAYEIERQFPFFFRSQRARIDPTYDFPMKSVARASSAAPTFFEPLKLNAPDSQDYYGLIDGGVFANNPTMCGFVDAQITHPDADDFLVVSLGTGEYTRRLPVEAAQNWGLIKWAQPLLEIVFHGVSEVTDFQMRQLLPPKNNLKRYYRFQGRLDARNNDLDDAHPDNLRELKLLGEKMIREQSEILDTLCKQLMSPALVLP